MKKVLIYHLHANDNITNNLCYKIHGNCLKYYKHIFDEMIFYVGVDDFNNTILLNDITTWICDICQGYKFDIKIRKNSTLCEVASFKEELIENIDKYKDTYVFFAHSKNATRLDKNLYPLTDAKPESIIHWCLSLYFYGLNFIKEMEGSFNGSKRASEMFYGPLLTQLRNPEESPMLRLNKGNCFYQGTFYWININKLINYSNNNIIKIPNIDDRFWVEMLPGVIGGRYKYGDGCSSHNDTAITEDFNLYQMNNKEWSYLIEILGNSEEYWDFYNKILNDIYNEK